MVSRVQIPGGCAAVEPENIPSRAVRVELKGEPLVRLRSGRRVIRAQIMTGLAERDGGGPVEWGPQAAVPAQHCARPGHVGVRSSWGSGGVGAAGGAGGGRGAGLMTHAEEAVRG